MQATDQNGTLWGEPVTLDSAGDVGRYASLAEVNGTAAIAYYDAINGDLKYVNQRGASVFADGFESGDTSAWSGVVP